ncbi:hypothetical protein MMC26_005168 [Xylographa opegraphella]|nr:hypothetical protein [Xylographa opegraphella]
MASKNHSFLPFDQKEKVLLLDLPDQEKKSASQEWSRRKSLLVHTLIVIMYGFISVAIIRTYTNQAELSGGLLSRSYSRRPQLYDKLKDNIFAGPPSPQLDMAWQNILENINIRVSKTELDIAHQTSVELPEGGGYLSWLGAFHELHCLKFVRQWTYKDHYHPNLTVEEVVHYQEHSDHCIEYLRQAAICHGDTSLVGFKWEREKQKPVMSLRRSPHMCIDWEQLMSSLKERVVDHDELARLANPLYNYAT